MTRPILNASFLTSNVRIRIEISIRLYQKNFSCFDLPEKETLGLNDVNVLDYPGQNENLIFSMLYPLKLRAMGFSINSGWSIVY